MQPARVKPAAELEAWLDGSGISPRGRARVQSSLLRSLCGQDRVEDCYLLRLPPGSPFLEQLRQAGVHRRLALLSLAHLAEYALWIASWWMIARLAFAGRHDPSWLVAWALVILTVIPFRMLSMLGAGRVALDVGSLLKRRLLAGALRLRPEEIRHQGAGRLLGCVIESEAVESLAINGGLMGVIALVEVAGSAWVLWNGCRPAQFLALWFGWLALLALAVAWHLRRRREWAWSRLALTHDLVEQMVGHRTRIAQEPIRHRHASEDVALDRYEAVSRRTDRSVIPLVGILPQGFLVGALVLLAPSFVAGAVGAAMLATTLGGIVLAYRALSKLTQGMVDLAGAAVGWRSVAPLFHAAARPGGARSVGAVPGQRGQHASEPAEATSAIDPAQVVLEAHDLRFRHPGRGTSVLRGLSLEMTSGDRVLLQGPSGGGKSTLCSILTAQRTADSGLLLLHGLDPQTFGTEEWRRRVVFAPQFHENHVFANTFAFNLLLGRGWPPQPEELQAAERLCRDLGLGPLLERMPSGLQQMVGENGWQLSHGEKSRVYIARALLQDADVVVLDESFASLDPRTLQQALECVLARARSLLVVAHP